MIIFCHFNFNLDLPLLEEFEDLKMDYQDKIKQMENTVNRLKMQLKSAQAELEQTRTALKTMEGSDGHGNYGLNFPEITHICLFNMGIFVSIDPSTDDVVTFQIFCVIKKQYCR